MTRGEFDRATRRALDILDDWIETTGAISRCSGYHDELEGVIEAAVHCGAQAATGDFRLIEGESRPPIYVPVPRS
jgi:hypothetical protein